MTNMYSTVTRGVTRILLLAACLLPTRAVADVSAVVESVERLPRTQRLAAYEAAMVRPGISEADRVVLIRAFSQHAKRLSPHHGPTSYRFDPSRWFAILNHGFKTDPADADILWALGKLLIDHQKFREALPVAATLEKAHPEHHHAVAWHAWCIYNSYSPEKGFLDDTSHGTRNSNRPYLLIDWTRLDNRGQNPGAHEMGHAFGLEHVGVPGATMATETNIMTSVGEGFGSGGKRNLGFTEAQAAVILHHAKRTYQRLGLSEPEP